jgi:hypothetical protein
MDLLRGIGPDGATVVFLDDSEGALVKGVSEFSGNPLAAPVNGTIAKKIATVDFVIKAVDDGDEVLAVLPTLAKADEPSQSVKDFNATVIAREPRLYLVKADSEDGGEVEQGLITFLAMECNDGSEGKKKPDTQNDVFNSADISKAMIFWMENGGQIDLMHSFEGLSKETVHVVECWQARQPEVLPAPGGKTYTAAKGSWLVTFRTDPEGDLWKAIKDGKINAVSPGGLARREPVTTAA